MNISHYAKALLYIALTAVTFLVTALSDNVVTVEELINLSILVLGAVGVYLVPNLSAGAGRYLKGAVAFLAAGLVAVLSFLSDGVTVGEWLQILLAAFAGIGVVIIPNEPPAIRQVTVIPR